MLSSLLLTHDRSYSDIAERDIDRFNDVKSDGKNPSNGRSEKPVPLTDRTTESIAIPSKEIRSK